MLTDTQCRTAKPKDKPYKLTDGKGLHLEVKPNGSKAWRYRFELRTADTAKESTFAIGDYAIAPRGETPEEAQARKNGRRFTLAEARDERVKARDLVRQGINPAQHRQLERFKREQENATTFEAVAKEWLALKDWADMNTCSPTATSEPSRWSRLHSGRCSKLWGGAANTAPTPPEPREVPGSTRWAIPPTGSSDNSPTPSLMRYGAPITMRSTWQIARR